MRPTDGTDERAAFEARVATHRAGLRGYCYRMLGSLQDAEDAVQETLLAAWRARDTFEGRASWRSWLTAIAHNCCLAIIDRRGRRVLAFDRSPASEGVELEPVVGEPVWIEPFPDEALQHRESVELAFVAALQRLSATQRAALILREVLGYDAAETAEILGGSVAAVNSALQRARANLAAKLPEESQARALLALGDVGQQALVSRFVRAWEARDVPALVSLLAADVRFAMPPIPSWFEGRDAVVRFFAERIFATPWRLVPLRVSGQLAFACYQGPAFHLGALAVVTVRGGLVSELTGFLDPAVHAFFDLSRVAPDEFSKVAPSEEA